MPTVPTYDNFRVAQNPAPIGAVQGPQGASPGEIAGEQTQRLGAGLQRSGDAATQIAASMQEMANQVRVNDAVNRARQAAQDLAYNTETGYLNQKGPAALTRPSGQDLATEYGGKLQEAMSDIAGTLGNDVQRRAFQIHAGDIATQFHGQVEQHMLGEFREHALSVQDGTINLTSDAAKRNWSSPDLIAPQLDALKAAVVQKGKIAGWSAAATDAALLTATSKVHTDVVMAALENNNPGYAISYLDKNRSGMTADDILRVQGHVNQSVWMNLSQGAVQQATQAAMPKIAPTNADRMFAITAQAESGNRDFNADGSIVTSAKGAQGRMQVMPTTNLDPGFGVRPAADNSPAERARVGRDYLQAMLQRYGDPAKAWAAYNWGPGNLDKALKEADAEAQTGAYRTPGAAQQAWFSKLPAETQKYVASNMKQLQSGGGQPPRPTEMEFVNSAVAQLPPGSSPQAIKMTREAAVTQFGVINKSMNEVGDNALAEGQRWLTQNPNATVEQMPPQLLDTIRQYAPGKYDDLVKFSKTLGRGDVVTNGGRYNDIVTHMDQYARMSDAGWNQLQTELSQVDFKRLSQERANFINGKSSDTSEGMNRAAVTRALNENLAAMKIPVSPGKDTDAAERLGGIRKFVDQSIFAAQQGTGKKLTPAEIAEHVNGLFATNVEFKNSVLGIPTGTSAMPLMAMTIKDLPRGAYDDLRRALITNGNKAPTDTDILNLYRRVHVRR